MLQINTKQGLVDITPERVLALIEKGKLSADAVVLTQDQGQTWQAYRDLSPLAPAPSAPQPVPVPVPVPATAPTAPAPMPPASQKRGPYEPAEQLVRRIAAIPHEAIGCPGLKRYWQIDGKNKARRGPALKKTNWEVPDGESLLFLCLEAGITDRAIYLLTANRPAKRIALDAVEDIRLNSPDSEKSTATAVIHTGPAGHGAKHVVPLAFGLVATNLVMNAKGEPAIFTTAFQEEYRDMDAAQLCAMMLQARKTPRKVFLAVQEKFGLRESGRGNPRQRHGGIRPPRAPGHGPHRTACEHRHGSRRGGYPRLPLLHRR